MTEICEISEIREKKEDRPPTAGTNHNRGLMLLTDGAEEEQEVVGKVSG